MTKDEYEAECRRKSEFNWKNNHFWTQFYSDEELKEMSDKVLERDLAAYSFDEDDDSGLPD